MTSITRENIKTILAEQGAEQHKAALAAVKGAAREYKGAQGKVEGATLAASLATYLAEQTGLLPRKGERAAGGEGGDMMTGAKYAETFGVQGSSVTAWRTLGYSVCVVGIDPEEESTPERMSTWRLMAFKGAATNKVVSEAVYADGATVGSVRTAVESVRDPASGKVKSGTGSKSGKPNKTTGTETDLTEAIKADPSAVALAVIRDVLRPAAAACTTEQWSQVETALNALIHREVTIRNGRTSAKAKADAESALDAVAPESATADAA